MEREALVCHCVCVWRAADNCRVILSFYPEGPRDGTQVVRVGTSVFTQ